MAAESGVVVRAPAKINLELRVGPVRPDGFHPLATVFQAVSLYDDVSATPRSDRRIEVSVTGDQAAGVPLDEDNLAVRAARALARAAGVKRGVNLHISKGIPVAGGMAGGSADAAATLVACDLLWQCGFSRDELAELAADLGSDVPFPLLGGTAVGTGRGEVLTPALHRGRFMWVMAFADGGLSTPAVFAEFDRQQSAPPPPPAPNGDLLAAVRSGDPAALAPCLVNDLLPAALALMPNLQRTIDLGLEAGALAAVISGSGPTVAFLVSGPQAGLEVAVALTASGVARDARRVQGPVPGARVTEALRG